MNERTQQEVRDYTRILANIGLLLIGIFFAILVCWMVLSKPNAKLFEADGVVCFSQPFQMECLKIR